ncbi:MAG TPA: outer membrane lipoprotein carrier protein LolA [Candidatus Binatia bacterium]|jgi:outer membrane lipoprotein carrier protein
MQGRSKGEKFGRFAGSLFLAAFLLFDGYVFAADQAPNEEQIVDNLQKTYESAGDFTADFRQETELKTVNRTLKASGKVSFKRPGKMFWSYDEPKGQWVLADGKNIYFYQPDQGQVLKSPLQSAFRSDVPLTFLLGIGNLKRDFKVTSKGIEDGQYVLHLGPKDGSPGVDEVTLGVDRQNFSINWARIRDPAGNLTTVRFSNIRRGVGLNDSVFKLQVPNGADVIDMGSK